MPSASELGESQRRLRRMLAIAVAVIAVLVVLVIVLLTRRGDLGAAPLGPPAQSSMGVPSAGGPVAVHRTTALPKPGDYFKGLYPVRFPHTPQGAVAAAAAMYQYVYTLEPATAQKVVDVYIAAEDRQVSRANAVDSVAFFREKMDLPASGPAPADATIAVQPIGVQWKTVDGDNVYASLDLRIDMLPGNIRPVLSSTAAVTVHMQWRGDVRSGDWVGLQTPPGKMPAPRFAELDTQEFDTEGWTMIRPGG